MKVILLEDVYNQGVAGEIVDVKPGYARNYLIPEGKAVKATEGMLRQFENLSRQAEMRRAEREKQMQTIADRIEEVTLYFPVRASDRGKLYGSVTMEQVAEALNEEIGLEIDRRRIGESSLRELGEHNLTVRLDTGLAPQVTVIVHRDDSDPRTQDDVVAEAEAVEAELLEGYEDYEDEAYEEAPLAVEEAPVEEGITEDVTQEEA